MRDRKSLFLLIVALIVVTISFVMISIWGYHFYYAKNKHTPQIAEHKTGMIHNEVQEDSLQLLVSTFNPELENDIDSALLDSSIDKNLASKIIEFNRLKSEISEIIRKKSSEKETSMAAEKIAQLQQSIEELKNKNDTIIQENERLNQMVKELMGKKETAISQQKSISKNALSNPVHALPVLVSHLRFVAYFLNDDKAVTNMPARAERLSGSFQVNIKPFNTDNSIYVVVIQPNGKILENTGGQLKSFMSQTGKKSYSTLLHFDNKKDNGSRLSFTIDSRNFQKGKYAMQIYHQGVMIGRLTRTFF